MSNADAETLMRREFGQQLSRIATAWRREVDRDLRSYNLTDAQWRPLYYLGQLPPPVRQTDLAQALSVEAPSLARVLDVLEKTGLVTRDVDGEDRRSKHVTLTRAGANMADRVRDAVDGVGARLLEGASTQALQDCLSVFGRVLGAVHNAREKRALEEGGATTDRRDESAASGGRSTRDAR
ncbi:MarR family transcriptional regulator [Acetobacter nitrogenifigens DSM 23921 = NBRC 105050]|uniref:Transcriptional regulator n=1 Tax=Acetobacter nitrogenifigens DSM 23921 = NBRC 105050 TaxID=1120919 RepID=A0A511X9X8_9PROT|nr:MarR family transcriptional regulator [Acetobacter nitrogenifigens]GBQ97954.1 MarR family transcriptional regulator [Acetobacter nitrogenifigens DSM 23921 = NBRC 105050]GEN59748.1 transcriptional regulator [Acetobacter nitrogenifigens DSM 23921 = NBRC 105050]